MGRITSAMKRNGTGVTTKKKGNRVNARQVSFGENSHRLIPSNRSDQETSSLTNFDDDDSSFLSSSDHSSLSIPNLQHSLMRTFQKKDPFEYYEVLEILGDGSMGSVSKVKKRKSALGGSARKSQQAPKNPCFRIFPCLSFCCPSTLIYSENKKKKNIFFADSSRTVSNGSSTSIGSTGDSSLVVAPQDGANANNPRKLKSTSSMVSFAEYGVVYALKSIILDHVADQTFVRELQNEIAILRTLDHPHICRAIETYDFDNRMYLVLELCSGGDLYTRDPYTEGQAKYIVRSLLDACAYLHKKKITHRDLKYENIMFASPTSPSVKIIDFGLSKKYSKDQILSKTVGTVYTMAPEIVAKKIMDGTFSFKGRRWKEVSGEAKDFVTSLLVHDRKQRPTCNDALKHDWFRGSSSSLSGGDSRNCGFEGPTVSSRVMDRVQATIQTFAGYSKLKKLALYVIAYKSSADEVGFLQQIFQNRFDVVKDGEISMAEFKEALKVYSYTDKELEYMFHAVDIDGCETLGYNEFLAATIEAHGVIEEGRIAEAFDRIDNDDDGYITVSNLTDFLGPNVSKEYIDSIIQEVDVSRDHRIDYDEFLGLWDGSFDKVLQENLNDVKRKRIKKESVSELTLTKYDEGEDGDFLEDEDSASPASDSVELAPPGAGTYFFDQEKEKSLRGEWV